MHETFSLHDGLFYHKIDVQFQVYCHLIHGLSMFFVYILDSDVMFQMAVTMYYKDILLALWVIAFMILVFQLSIRKVYDTGLQVAPSKITHFFNSPFFENNSHFWAK